MQHFFGLPRVPGGSPEGRPRYLKIIARGGREAGALDGAHPSFASAKRSVPRDALYVLLRSFFVFPL